MLQDSQAAEDCLQDTFLKAFQAYPKISDVTHLRAWLYKIAKNTALDLLRKSNKQYDKNIDSLSISDNQNIESEVNIKITLESIRHFIETLPIKQKTALLLHRYHGFSYTEIAQSLNCSEDTARANVYQAIKKIRQTFSKEIE